MSEHVISVRLNEEEYGTLKTTAIENKVTVSDVLRIGAEVIGRWSPEMWQSYRCPTCGRRR